MGMLRRLADLLDWFRSRIGRECRIALLGCCTAQSYHSPEKVEDDAEFRDRRLSLLDALRKRSTLSAAERGGTADLHRAVRPVSRQRLPEEYRQENPAARVVKAPGAHRGVARSGDEDAWPLRVRRHCIDVSMMLSQDSYTLAAASVPQTKGAVPRSA